MTFDQTPEFRKELKAFSKKWRSLLDDLAVLMKVLPSLYMSMDGVPVEQIREAFFGNKKAAVLHKRSDTVEVVKVRLDCWALGNKDILRVTYLRRDNHILFLELFAKNQKPREDTARIKRYLSAL